ncbi:hypothetical protein ACJMK2_018464 [Sinanodonta woodiana]|uniref:Androgen-dependent TFPI-regulating protein n=1 Tax=Sinanodonta woodiana TaxID=1069815 RepID=A0ABD3UFK0_SINWO
MDRAFPHDVVLTIMAERLHTFVFLMYACSLSYNIAFIGLGQRSSLFQYEGYGGKFKYLTFWNFILQTVYFGICVVNDIWGTNCQPSHGTKGKLRSNLQILRDNVFAALAYPIGMFVVITFWSIYMVDRELVFPKRLDDIIPSWLNHVMHTTVLPILLLEKYLVYHQYPSKKMGLTILLTFSFAYLAWILWIAYYANIWVYPVLKVMEAHQRILFITLLMVFFISIYILGEAVNKFIWRRETVSIHQKQK